MAASSAAELEPVVKVTARLQALLERAKEVKPETTVDPALPVADFALDVENLHDDFDKSYDQTLRFITVEAAIRDLFYPLITSADINEPAFVAVWNLLDIVLMCGDHQKCAPELVCWLLEELLDSQTTHGCRTVFDFLDSRRERLAQKDFHKKNLIFLRSCNELLRRLSRAEDAIFCGRVFFFLFQTFPLGDKSSVNLRGEFHTENTTKFEVPVTEESQGEQMQIDSKPSEAPAQEQGTPQPTPPTKPGSKAIPIKAPPKKTPEEEILSNSELYPIFWRLQHDFCEPTRLFDLANFAAFKKALGSTIAKFKNTPTVVQTKTSEDASRGKKRKHGEDGIDEESEDHLVDNYNPKYLTSRDLFDLEMSDLAFQRNILVQALILIEFLLSLTEKAKKKIAELPTANKSMLYSFTLSEEDAAWAISTRTNIKTYLETTTEGRHFYRTVETALARDKHWIRWKIENCPSMIRGPVSTDDELEARKNARTATRPGPTKRSGNMMDLSFLEPGSGGGLEALKDPSRYTGLTIEQLVESVKVDKLDMDFADGEEKEMLTNKIVGAGWRALRQARAFDLSLLDKVDTTKDLEEMQEMLKRPDHERQQQQQHQHVDGEATGDASEPAATGKGDDASANGTEHLPVDENTTSTTTAEDKVMEDAETK